MPDADVRISHRLSLILTLVKFKIITLVNFLTTKGFYLENSRIVAYIFHYRNATAS